MHKGHFVPNLQGLFFPQNYQMRIDTSYGLGFVESRTYACKKALSDPNVYAIAFIDDDILPDLRMFKLMLDSNLPVVSANYMKKNNLAESVTSNLQRDDEFVFKNEMVNPENPCTAEFPFGDPKKLSVLEEINCTGGGSMMIRTDLLRQLPEPWFQFMRNTQTLPDGRVIETTVQRGEDDYFINKCLAHGVVPKIFKNLCGIHCDFQTGLMYGPDWIVKDNKIRPEMKPYFTEFAVDPKELFCRDVDESLFPKSPEKTAIKLPEPSPYFISDRPDLSDLVNKQASKLFKKEPK